MEIVKEMLIVMTLFALFVITIVVGGSYLESKMNQAAAEATGLNVVSTWTGCYAKEDGIPYTCDYILRGKTVILEKSK